MRNIHSDSLANGLPPAVDIIAQIRVTQSKLSSQLKIYAHPASTNGLPVVRVIYFHRLTTITEFLVRDELSDSEEML